VNVLKPYLENTVITLLKKGFQQRQINRKTGVDRKTIRRIRRQLAAAAAIEANSSTLATGSGPPGVAENPPPWPQEQRVGEECLTVFNQHSRSLPLIRSEFLSELPEPPFIATTRDIGTPEKLLPPNYRLDCSRSPWLHACAVQARSK
jgi:hypothetical protein